MDKNKHISENEIWDYLNGSCSAETRAKIDLEINSNDVFKSELEETKQTWIDLNSIQERKELRQSFNQYHSEHFDKNNSIPINRKKRKKWVLGLSIAAGFALIFTLGNMFFNNNLTESSENMAYQEMKKEDQGHEDKSAGNAQINANIPSQATAFAINDSLLMTSYHAIKNKNLITVSQSGSRKWIHAEFVAAHEEFDIALIKINPDSVDISIFPIYLEKHNLELGQEIYGLGYPKSDLVYGKGDVSSLTGFQGDTNSIQVSVPTNPGNSGTPLFNEQGALISMIIGKNIQEDGSAYATSNKEILMFLEAVSLKMYRKNLLKRKKHLDQIKKLKTAIFLLKS